MNTALGIAAVIAGASTGMLAGVLWPDLRGRRQQTSVSPSDNHLDAAAQLIADTMRRVSDALPTAEEFAQSFRMEAATEAAATVDTVEVDRPHPAEQDEPTVARALLKAKRRSQRNSSGKRRKRHGRR